MKCVDCETELPAGSKWSRQRCDSCNVLHSRVRARDWYKNNRDRVLKYHKERREADIDKALSYERQTHHKRDKSKLNAYANARRAANPEADREYHASWREKNRDRVREQGRANEKTRRDNPGYRAYSSISTMIRMGIKNKNRRSWESVVGYTREQLMAHLEDQFLPGMSWENYGMFGWHIDHIRPRASFAFERAEDNEFKECWALNNLRPLWAFDNWSKGARYEAAA